MFIMWKVHSSEKLLYIQKDDFLCLSIVGSVTIHTFFLTYTYTYSTYSCSYFGVLLTCVQSTGGGLGHSPW